MFHLMDVVPIIVIDAHKSTDGVVEEIERIEQRKYFDRTGYVVDDKSAQPPSEKWETVPRNSLPQWVREKLFYVVDEAERLKRQFEFSSMLASVPRGLREPYNVKAMVAKARCIQHAEICRFIHVCKGVLPSEAEDRLLEDIPSRVTRREELAFLRTSRGLDEVEVLLRSALEEAEAMSGPSRDFNIANSYNSLGALARVRCDWPEAERLISEAIKRLERLRSSATHGGSAMQELATAYFNLGDVSMARYRERGTEVDRREAMARFHRSIQIDLERNGNTDVTKRRLDDLEARGERTKGSEGE
ncbi:MAG: tetratricopeptide repeat protein [Pseudomonadota bacterium]